MKNWLALLVVVFFVFSCKSQQISERVYTTYEIAAIITGTPERLLRGFAFTESTYSQDALGDDGISKGRFQINETFHEYRARLYGEYNPWCPLESAILTGRIYQDSLAQLGNERDAIAAHRQGVEGVRRNGRDEWYVDRVLSVGK